MENEQKNVKFVLKLASYLSFLTKSHDALSMSRANDYQLLVRL